MKESLKVFCLVLWACSLLACVGEVQDISGERVGEAYNVGEYAEDKDTTPPIIVLPYGEGGAGGGEEIGGGGTAGGSDAVGGAGGDGGGTALLPLIFTPSNKCDATIVVGGSSKWEHFFVYSITNDNDVAVYIDQVTIQQQDPNGDAADFVSVAAGSGSVILAEGVLSSIDQSVTLDLSVKPLVVQPHSSDVIHLLGQMAPVMAGSTANFAWHGVARSGHTPTLHLTSFSANKGQISSDVKPNIGCMHELRKSMPFVTKHDLPSNVLANMDLDLYKLHVAAHNAGSIALKQVQFAIECSGPGLALGNFRLRRGSSELNPGDYAITGAVFDGGDFTGLQDLTVSALQGGQYATVFVSFANEETIVGAGNVYTLHATVSGAVSGSKVTVGLSSCQGPANATGYIVNNSDWGINKWAHPQIYLLDYGDKPGVELACGKYLWSDNSEVPHSAAVHTGNGVGSRDWTVGIPEVTPPIGEEFKN